MDNDFAIKLQDVTLEIPAKRRLPHGARRETNGTPSSSTQIGGRLSYGRGSAATVTILEDVSINISRGQRVGLIGANGAGKSTLLRVMAGIYFPTRGLAETYGKVSTLFPELLGVRPDATGLENIVLTGILLGLTRKEINRRIPEIIEFTELGDYIYMPIRTYSSGMRTRLVLSIATCISPDILLVDEVIGTGDKSFRLKAKDRLNEMMTSANTLVVVSQSPEIIREFCTEAIWLDRGQVRAVGGVNEVLGKYATEVTPPGEVAMRDIQALLAARDTLSREGTLNWSESIPVANWDGITIGGTPRRVTQLIVHQNQLGGTIPPELGELTELTTLSLNGNRLSGGIPAQLSQLSKLTALHLHTNRLEGRIPPALGQLTNLRQLHLQNNRLSGPIPAELGKLTNLDGLWLSDNQLSEEIPHDLGRLTNLAQLNLRSNRLSGSIPPELGNLGTNLQRLRLNGNRLTGCVPAGLAGVTDSDISRLGLPICSDA
ncbi:MAG: ATP-binding cassette domain-containing protein [Dehalococcoidia bacterium]|nr:ATP-binding cassette domain-containing protein [Dehalococcoidia bacterium]